MEKDFKSGFVSIIGRTNVGKSTLINNIMGEKLNIISNKPQTTRNSVKSIYTKDNFQIIFIDTPGIHKPKHRLGEYMVSSAVQSLEGVDVLIALVDSSAKIAAGDSYVFDLAKATNTKKILALNKIDKINKHELEELLAEVIQYQNDFDAVIPISAEKGNNINILMEEIKKLLPKGPMYFPADMIIDMPERFIVAEYIREKILYFTREEIPHGTAVEVMSMKEREDKEIIDIEANIYCEKKSHKGIIIGKDGSMIKIIGSSARADIEKLLNIKVNLQLWIKVRKDWRDSKSALKDLGYK